MNAERYPIEALADALGISVAALGRLLRVNGSAWKRYREEGVSERVADRLAVRAGLHPWEVWPAMADAAVAAEVGRRRARAARWRASERGRESMRAAMARYRSDPAVRAYRARYMAAWRAANRERHRENSRRDHARHAERRNAAKRERYATDPEYRQRVLEAQRRRDRAKAARRRAGQGS